MRKKQILLALLVLTFAVLCGAPHKAYSASKWVLVNAGSAKGDKGAGLKFFVSDRRYNPTTKVVEPTIAYVSKGKKQMPLVASAEVTVQNPIVTNGNTIYYVIYESGIWNRYSLWKADYAKRTNKKLRTFAESVTLKGCSGNTLYFATYNYGVDYLESVTPKETFSVVKKNVDRYGVIAGNYYVQASSDRKKVETINLSTKKQKKLVKADRLIGAYGSYVYCVQNEKETGLIGEAHPRFIFKGNIVRIPVKGGKIKVLKKAEEYRETAAPKIQGKYIKYSDASGKQHSIKLK